MDEMNTSQEIEIGMGIHNEEGFGKVEKVYQNLS